MRILLINPSTDIGQIGLFPSGLAYIAKSLKMNNIGFDVWDFNALRPSWTKIEEKIKDVKYDLIGVGGLIITYDYVKKLVGMIKKYHRESKIVIGDSLGSSVFDLVLNNIGADYVCLGEGEEVIINLIDCITKNTDINSVKGIAYKNNEKIVCTEKEPLCQNLDKYGMPDLESFPIDLYLKRSIFNFAKRPDTPLSLPKKQFFLTAHRGCPYLCNFCYQIFGRELRHRSITNIIQEISYLHEKYNVDFIEMGIDLFIADKKFIYAFCEEYKKSGLHLKVKWGTAGRANLMNKDLLLTLKDAGCILISYGFESASQTILDIIGKNITIKQMENTIKLTRDTGINMTYSFMIGQPRERKETITESVDFIKKHNLYVQRFFFATPYPGTELYGLAEKKGLIKDKEQFVSSLQSATKFLVNLTELSDQQLLTYYKTAVKEVREHYKRMYPSVYIKKKLNQIFKINKKNIRSLQKYKERKYPEWI